MKHTQTTERGKLAVVSVRRSMCLVIVVYKRDIMLTYLKLCDGCVPVLSVCRLVLAAVEPFHLIIELSRERDGKSAISGLECAAEG